MGTAGALFPLIWPTLGWPTFAFGSVCFAIGGVALRVFAPFPATSQLLVSIIYHADLYLLMI